VAEEWISKEPFKKDPRDNLLGLFSYYEIFLISYCF
jgi:hypothetical protein